jgi:hypothetical protein
VAAPRARPGATLDPARSPRHAPRSGRHRQGLHPTGSAARPANARRCQRTARGGR